MSHIQTYTDEQLVKLFIDGNADAIKILIGRYKDKVFTSINLLIKDKYAAEDIFQDLFIKVIDTLQRNKYNEEGKFSGWLMRVTHNMCMDHFRRMKTRPIIRTSEDIDIFDMLSFSAPAADHSITRTQSHNTIRQMIDQLPEEQREIIILRHYADMSFKDIAGTVKCSINTALGRMRYGLINLRKMMNEKELAL